MEKNLPAEIVKKYGLLIALSLVLFLSVVDIFFVSVSKEKIESAKAQVSTTCQSEGDGLLEDIPKISEISGPMITEKAAFSVCSVKTVPICKSLDANVWMFLLVSYVALMVFNLGYGIMKNQNIQWAWEAIMTGVFLSFWFALDECVQNLWYPLYVTKLGIAIYVVYIYFFFRKKDPKSV